MKNNKISLVTNIISIVIVMVYVIFLIADWRNIPSEIPTHFNAAGVADDFGNKGFLVIEPIIAAGLLGLFAFIERHPGAWNMPVRITEENMDRLYTIMYVMLGIIKVIGIIICVYTGLASVTGSMPLWPVIALTAGIFVTVIAGCIISFRFR